MNFLAIDIGNTSILFAYCRGKKILKQWRLRTHEQNTRALASIQKNISGKKIDAAVIASVVPAASAFLKKNLPRRWGIKTLVIGKDIPAPVGNRYKNPKQVGMDRLMNAVAIANEYKKDAIVIDFGTAITFDLISKTKGYLGGVIAPGIEITLEALFQKTALLPKIQLKHTSASVGRDTVESIRIGCAQGIGGLCDRLVQHIQAGHKRPLLVLATGGYAPFMRRYCRSFRHIDPNLVLKGIFHTYRASLK